MVKYLVGEKQENDYGQINARFQSLKNKKIEILEIKDFFNSLYSKNDKNNDDKILLLRRKYENKYFVTDNIKTKMEKIVDVLPNIHNIVNDCYKNSTVLDEIEIVKKLLDNLVSKEENCVLLHYMLKISGNCKNCTIINSLHNYFDTKKFDDQIMKRYKLILNIIEQTKNIIAHFEDEGKILKWHCDLRYIIGENTKLEFIKCLIDMPFVAFTENKIEALLLFNVHVFNESNCFLKIEEFLLKSYLILFSNNTTKNGDLKKTGMKDVKIISIAIVAFNLESPIIIRNINKLFMKNDGYMAKKFKKYILLSIENFKKQEKTLLFGPHLETNDHKHIILNILDKLNKYKSNNPFGIKFDYCNKLISMINKELDEFEVVLTMLNINEPCGKEFIKNILKQKKIKTIDDLILVIYSDDEILLPIIEKSGSYDNDDDKKENIECVVNTIKRAKKKILKKSPLQRFMDEYDKLHKNMLSNLETDLSTDRFNYN